MDESKPLCVIRVRNHDGKYIAEDRGKQATSRADEYAAAFALGLKICRHECFRLVRAHTTSLETFNLYDDQEKLLFTEGEKTP